MKLATILIAAGLFLTMSAISSAQHGKEEHGGKQQGGKSGQHEKGHGNQGHENRGGNHGGHENHGGHGGEGREHNGHRVDEGYRHEHFGREHSMRCRELGWDRGRFFYGGVYWNLVVFPDYWYPYDVVYIDYVDGDYFLFNVRLGARVAIVIE